MEVYTVSFFGHREVENPLDVAERTEKIVREIIRNKEYVDFLVGRDGDYDRIASSAVRRIGKGNDYGNSSLILVLPYDKAEYRDNKTGFEDYYDEIEICHESAVAHPKAAIQIRNRSMVDRSDLVVCCIERPSGGAYQTVMYAKRQHKEIFNVAYNNNV